MNIIIIGASGFVGRHLINYIMEKHQWKIIATKQSMDNFYYEGIDIVSLNLTNFDDVLKLIINYKPDYLINLAAQSSVKHSWQNPQKTIEINVQGTLNLLEAIRLHSPQTKTLLIGSSEEYGTFHDLNNQPSENIIGEPTNPYAISKHTINYFAKMYSKSYDLNVICTRSFNHFGPGQSETFVVSDFCRQVALIENNFNKPIISVGNLEVKRDFTDVRDIVSAYCKLLEFGIKGETYNVGSGNLVSIKDILDKLLSFSKIKIDIEVDLNKFRPIETKSIYAVIKKIKNHTNWYPEIDIDQTIYDTLEYWRSNLSDT
jgi:GDP-4-dehydro-6-deoxy-D-mannose reductase